MRWKVLTINRSASATSANERTKNARTRGASSANSGGNAASSPAAYRDTSVDSVPAPPEKFINSQFERNVHDDRRGGVWPSRRCRTAERFIRAPRPKTTHELVPA